MRWNDTEGGLYTGIQDTLDWLGLKVAHRPPSIFRAIRSGRSRQRYRRLPQVKTLGPNKPCQRVRVGSMHLPDQGKPLHTPERQQLAAKLTRDKRMIDFR